MELSKLKPNPTTRVELKNAPGLFVILASRDNPEVKAVINKATEKRIAVMRGGRPKPFSVSEMEAESLAVLRAAVQGIDDQTGEGEPMEFTPENVSALLAIDWVRRDLDEAMGNDALFFGD